MFNWLKFISGSIILDNDAKSASKRKFWNVLFFLFATLILMSFILSTSYNIAFKSHYNHSKDYKEAYEYALNNEEYNCMISDQKLSCADKNNRIEEDKNKKLYLDTRTIQDYTGKYEVIVDSRDRDTHVDFLANYEHKKEKNVISHLEYLKLESKDREDYQFKDLIYTNINLDYDVYLPLATNYYNEVGGTAKENYIAIDKDEKLTLEEKNVKKIDMFVKAALPGVINDYDKAPILNAYYATEFLKQNSKKEFGYEHDRFILILQETTTSSFVTDKNIFVSYEGSYRQIKGSFQFHYEKVENNPQLMMEHVDEFVGYIYGDISGTQLLNYLFNIFRYMPFILLMMAALALFMFLMTRLSNDDYADNKYIGCFKITAACSLGATLCASIVGFILQFFMNQGVAFVISMLLFISFLILRVVLLVVISFFKKRAANKRLQDPIQASEKMELL